MQTVPGPGRLRDELVTGIDQELQVRARHFGRDPREALLTERDAPHGNGISPAEGTGLNEVRACSRCSGAGALVPVVPIGKGPRVRPCGGGQPAWYPRWQTGSGAGAHHTRPTR